jgi:hypothetical protein
MFCFFVFLLPLVLGEQFLFYNEKDLERELPQCIGNGILTCQRVRLWIMGLDKKELPHINEHRGDISSKNVLVQSCYFRICKFKKSYIMAISKTCSNEIVKT